MIIADVIIIIKKNGLVQEEGGWATVESTVEKKPGILYNWQYGI
jgi:hypothetical protein